MQDSCTLQVSYKILASYLLRNVQETREVSCTIHASLASLLQERGHFQCTFSSQNVQELARYFSLDIYTYVPTKVPCVIANVHVAMHYS